MPETVLPTKLSELLRLAVTDAQECELDPAVELDMSDWLVPARAAEGRKICAVCMAGAVMLKTLEAETQFRSEPEDFGDEGYALLAINELRVGDLDTAAVHMGIVVDEDVHERFGAIVRGDFDVDAGRASWDTYLSAAQYLEEKGL